MNTILENWLNEQKAQTQQERNKKREAHLRRLGLIDKSKTDRKIFTQMEYGAKWDEEQKVYYTESHPVIDVTDEEYELICKFAPPSADISTDSEEGLDLTAEKKLNFFAKVYYVLGIICVAVFILWAIIDFETVTVIPGIVIGFLLISQWAIIKVFIDISKTLKQIRKEK